MNKEDDVDMTTLLKPVSMVKIAVLGLKKYRQQVISILQEMSVMQLEPISKEADSFLMAEHESEYHRQVSESATANQRINQFATFFTCDRKNQIFIYKELIQKVKSMDIDGKIASLERQKDNALTAMKGTENNITLLEEFSFFPEDLNILHLSSARSFFGRMNSEKFPEFKKKLELNDEEVMLYARECGKTTRFVVVVMSRFPSNAFASVISLYNVHLEAVPNLKGKPGVALEGSEKKIPGTFFTACRPNQ